jgi:hypothetical protein
MSELPEPLVPAEVDLRDFAFMPLDVRRLFTSETWLLGSFEERCAALTLWGESWHQVPAASMPDNDRILAHLSQTHGRWAKVKEHALRGWVKCSDGRWYHPVVAEKALEAWAKHKRASSKGKAGASKRWGTGNGTGIKQLMPADSNGQGHGNREGGTRKGSRCPTEFEVSEEMSAWAVSEGLPAERVLPETEKFLDHFRGSGVTKKDWHATWRNWVRKAIEFRGQR